MKSLEQLTDQDAIEVFEIIGGEARTNEAKAFQVKQIIATNKFYNTSTNIPGAGWIKIFNYLRSKGYSLPYESPSGADSSVLVRALQRIEFEYFDGNSPNSIISNIRKIAREALAEYNAQPPSLPGETPIEEDQELMWRFCIDNILGRNVSSQQDFDKALSHFMNKYRIEKKDNVHQTPRTPISQPGELDTVGEHPSGREPEETEIEKLKDSLGAAKMALEAIMKGEAIFPRTLAQQTLMIINGE